MIQYIIHLIIFVSLLSNAMQLLPDISTLINQVPLSFLKYKEESNMTFDNDKIINYIHYYFIQPIIGNATSNITGYQNNHNKTINKTISDQCLHNVDKYIARNISFLVNDDEKKLSYYYLQKLIWDSSKWIYYICTIMFSLYLL